MVRISVRVRDSKVKVNVDRVRNMVGVSSSLQLAGSRPWERPDFKPDPQHPQRNYSTDNSSNVHAIHQLFQQ